MKIKTDPAGIFGEYNRGVAYNTGIELYETVERNENFYNDKQWEGVNAPDIDKPVFNFLKPVVNYYVSMLISDDIAANIEIMGAGEAETRGVSQILSSEVDAVLERENMCFKNKKLIRNCAVDGDACCYLYFDPEQDAIRTEIVDNTNVYFGNPSTPEVESQPYILISYRRLTEEVQDEAQKNGCPAEAILPDEDDAYLNPNRDTENQYTTVVLKMWKERDGVHLCKVTRDAYVKKPVCVGYQCYPLSYMTWESKKNSYHGVSPLTGKITNQIYVNKLYAMSMEFTVKQAFPKILYDRTKLPDGWNSKVGQAVAVAGNPNDAIFASFAPAGLSSGVNTLIQNTIAQTKDLMGASDSALGNVKPDNTSAIIALQKASAMPLDIQKRDFYNFVEGYVRVMIEMMRVHYGVRRTMLKGDGENKTMVEFDFAEIGKYNMHLKVDIGEGSYWSELMQVETLNNLMDKNIIPDAKTYLEAVPDGYIKNKGKILAAVKAAGEQTKQSPG